jgi:hypothetical protein
MATWITLAEGDASGKAPYQCARVYRQKGKRMKLKSILLSLFLLLPVTAFGDQQTELAEEFMELTHVNKMMEEIKAQVLQMQDQIMTHMQIPEGKQEEAAAFKKEVHQTVLEIMDFEQMRNEYIELFTRMYSDE